MKYLAILKDSLLETIDFKIFYVMLALSVVLCLVLAIFTFPRHEPEQALANNLEAFEVQNVQAIKRDWFSPHARYRVTLTPKKETGLATSMQHAIAVYQAEMKAMELAMRGRFREIEEARTNLPAPPPDPTDVQGWRDLFDVYTASIHGASDARVQTFDMDATGRPKQIEIELSINWGELRKAHDFCILYGVYRVEMGDVPLGQIVSIIQSTLVGWIAGWIGIIVSIIVTAGFLPNMLRKGTIDLLLVKPISRVTLLVYKYLGGLTFVFFNALVLVGGTWIVFGLTTDYWSPWYLASVFVLTFFFAILYSFSALIGVLTRSTLASVLLTIGMWAVVWVIGTLYALFHPADIQIAVMPFLKDIPEPIVKVVDAIHFVLPKTSDLKVLNEALLLQANGSEEALRQQEQVLKNFSWSETIYTSFGFIAVMLGLASWRFARRDY